MVDRREVAAVVGRDKVVVVDALEDGRRDADLDGPVEVDERGELLLARLRKTKIGSRFGTNQVRYDTTATIYGIKRLEKNIIDG